jgi:DNA-binding NarL/FixJ family response regulator
VTRPRVLLADDHAFLRAAFAKMLTPECDVIGEVSDGRALVAAAEMLKPDVIVIDISMPILNGFEAGRQIKRRLPGVKLVFLTLHDDEDVAAEAFRAGASAYVIKGRAASDLRVAIREVCRGRTFVTRPLSIERD